jgi:TetR/AcrR family transcriptional regulator, cholesterol catabolism regulator
MDMVASARQRASRSPGRLRRESSILAAARLELTEKGYEGVTMEALALRAGVVKKTLYNLYGSKDALLIAAISEVIAAYRGPAGGAERGIPAMIASRVAASRQIAATPEYADAMARALGQAGPGHPLVRVLLQDAVADCVLHLEAARADRELVPDVDIAEVAEQLISQVWGLILLWQKGLVPLCEFERRAVRGLLIPLLAVTRGARRRMLQELLQPAQIQQKEGRS